MSVDFTIKRHDLLPAIEAYLRDENQNAVDLSNASGVYFYFRPLSTQVTMSGQASVVSASEGRVKYSWNEGDTSIPGIMDAEWEISFSGKTMTFPSASYIKIRVLEDLA